MSLSTVLRAVLRRWYIVIPGVLLSLLIASTVFSAIPAKYTSSGIAVLVRQSNPTVTNLVNPVLGGDGSLNTATLTLIQALDTPTVKLGLGLKEGVDDFAVNNVGKANTVGGADHPFLYITTQSSDPQKSAEIVTDVIDIGRQKLAELQNDFHVRPQSQIKLESVVDATPPKAVMSTSFAIAGAVLMLGIVTTCISACVWDRIIVAQQRRRIRRFGLRTEENVDRPARVTRKIS